MPVIRTRADKMMKAEKANDRNSVKKEILEKKMTANVILIDNEDDVDLAVFVKETKKTANEHGVQSIESLLPTQCPACETLPPSGCCEYCEQQGC